LETTSFNKEIKKKTNLRDKKIIKHFFTVTIFVYFVVYFLTYLFCLFYKISESFSLKISNFLD